ncbi:MAG: oligosaccharide flippase family protein [Dehalococcoidia bacterium]|nr:oligosaccharide flippase family protein [Dehalococcoidia bacterium]
MPVTSVEQPHQRLSSALARTAAALLSVQAITWLSSVIAITIVPRKLGAHELGLLASVMMFVTVIAKFAGLGMSQHLVREVARDASHAAELAAEAIAWRILAGLAVMWVAGVALWAFGAAPLTLLIFALIAAGGLAGLVQDVASSCMQGNYTLGRLAAFTGTVALLTQMAIAAALLLGGGAVSVALWTAVGGGVSALVAIAVFSRQFRLPRLSTWPRPALLRSGLPFLSWEASLLIYGSSGFLLLPLFTGGDTVGNYALAYRIAGVPIFITAIITSTIYPALAQAHAQGRARWFSDALTRSIGVSLLATVPLAVGIAIDSGSIINVTGGTGEFSSSALLLTVLVLHLPLVAFNTVQGMSLFARDRQAAVAVTAWGAVLLNVLGNLIAIPLFDRLWANPAMGSVAVTLGTEVYMTVMLLCHVHPTLAKPQLGTWLLRAGITGGAVALVLVLGRPLGTLPAIGLAGVVYLVAGYAFAGRELLRDYSWRPRRATAPQSPVNVATVE